ncbi:hypothetical protein [Pseudogulbenkiania sp. MAI-1]|uniref:hypothetical protein n=1 Tax=Pseudogulbenkiania sp. MAI-1 TaxID=990370 RepID=UPI0012EB3008|nr:hypothetical protein [Pseudogulbenkiania sp. MAI-1]
MPRTDMPMDWHRDERGGEMGYPLALMPIPLRIYSSFIFELLAFTMQGVGLSL